MKTPLYRRLRAVVSTFLILSSSMTPAVFADQGPAKPLLAAQDDAPSPSIQVTSRDIPASEENRRAFGVHVWSLRTEEGPTGLRDTHIVGLDASGEPLGRIHLGAGQGGESSLLVVAPYLPGAARITREVRDQGWLDAFTADLKHHAAVRTGPLKSSGEPLDPDLCNIKRLAAAAAFTAAVAACEPTPGIALCAAAIATLVSAIDDMNRACGDSSGTLCTPGTAAPCSCSYRDCDDNIILGIKICNPAGSAYSSCIGCPTSKPDCPDPNFCEPEGTVDASNWCAENECDGEPGSRTCGHWNTWDRCTCAGDPPSNECDFEGQTAPAACSGEINCPLGSQANKVCVADPIDSNLTWSECFCDGFDEGGSNEVEDPEIDDVPGGYSGDCEFGPDACTTEVSGRQMCRRCNVTDVATGNCLIWYPWRPC